MNSDGIDMTLNDFFLWYNGFVAGVLKSGVPNSGLTEEQWEALKGKIESIKYTPPSIFFPPPEKDEEENKPWRYPWNRPPFPEYTPPRDYIWCGPSKSGITNH